MPKKTSSSRTKSASDPRISLEQNLQRIYVKNTLEVGLSKNFKGIFSNLARAHSVAIVGVALGDEGKGRIVDNKIETLLQNKKIKKVAVVRFQGGNNAGHTVEKGEIKLALHLIPSFVLHQKALGIMDRGMLVHVEDLQTEVTYVEEAVGSLAGKLFLSDDAILCTDLERAEEVLNSRNSEKTKGGTGRGIGPGYAHHYDKSGLRIADLLEPQWRETLSKRYDQYEKMFASFDFPLNDVEVPDFRATIKSKKAAKKKLGSKHIFLSRIEEARDWLLKRHLITNTYKLHEELSQDPSVAIVFEGAQAAGLDSWNGVRPDVTSSNTTVYGIRDGTGFWRVQDVAERIGILKLPYTSSVGARRMPTHIDLPRDTDVGKTKNLSEDQTWALWIRETANEYGTTTGRPRDINFLDLPFIAYNIRMSGIETIMATHLDIARVEDQIKICTHYTDKKGNTVSYQPGIRYIKDVTPHYITVPGWDGAMCQKARKAEDLPIHALKFLSFLQAQLNIPIIATTTGPRRDNFITF